MATAAKPVQAAIWAKLAADAEFTAAAGQLRDHVDGNAAHPYVTLGGVVEVPQDAHDAQGLLVTATLHIWSKYLGFAEALDILGHLDRVLDRKPLVVEGFTNVSVAREWHETMRDPDPQIRHIPVRFRIWLTKEN